MYKFSTQAEQGSVRVRHSAGVQSVTHGFVLGGCGQSGQHSMIVPVSRGHVNDGIALEIKDTVHPGFRRRA
jgi:hypothetical protein